MTQEPGWFPLNAWWHPMLAGLLYYGAALAAVEAALTSERLATVLPANAVLLVALLRSPLQRWPLMVLAVLVAALFADFGMVTPLQSMLFGLIGCIEAALVVLWLDRLQPGRFTFDRPRGVVGFAIGVPGVACALAGFAGAGVFGLGGDGAESYWTYWQGWWLGDGVAMLMFTPALLAWVDGSPWLYPRGPARLEFVILLALTTLVSLWVFSDALSEAGSPVTPMVLFPFSIWVASRFGVRSVAAVTLMIGVIAIYYTREQRGPFADEQAAHAVLHLQTFLVSISVCALAIAALLTELRQRNAQLRLRDRALESIGEGVLIADALQPDLPITYVNPTFEALTGYRAAEVLGRNCRFLQGEDRQQEALESLRAALQRGAPAHVLLRNYRKDGSAFLNDLIITPVHDDNQQLRAFVGIQRDVTALHDAEARLAEAYVEVARTNKELEQRVADRTRELERANTQLDNLAHTDSLTGLWNRRYFLAAAQRAISASQRHGRPLCLLMIDIDHFKVINDLYGHSGGDQALLSLVQAIRVNLRPSDVFARFGGEEFIAVLVDTPHDEAVRVAERWRLAVAAARTDYQGQTITLTISIGVVQWHSGWDLDQLVSQADHRLYAAKAAGRNQVCA